MIRVKMLPRNETCIIDNGKSYIFGLNGICKEEDAGKLSSYMVGALDLPIISILSCNGKLDIGVSDKGSFKNYICDMDAMQCAMTLQMQRHFIKMLRRDGKQDNKSYNQLIFVYPEGTNLTVMLNAIGAKEVTQCE